MLIFRTVVYKFRNSKYRRKSCFFQPLIVSKAINFRFRPFSFHYLVELEKSFLEMYMGCIVASIVNRFRDRRKKHSRPIGIWVITRARTFMQMHILCMKYTIIETPKNL